MVSLLWHLITDFTKSRSGKLLFIVFISKTVGKGFVSPPFFAKWLGKDRGVYVFHTL